MRAPRRGTPRESKYAPGKTRCIAPKREAHLEVATDEPEHPSIRDVFRHAPHEQVVMDSVEELYQVDIHDPAPTTRHVALRVTHRLMRAPPRPKVVAVL